MQRNSLTSAVAQGVRYDVTETPRPKVTIAISAYNEQNNIGHVLESLLEQRLPFDYEIVVVSDGSTDLTASIVREVSKANPIVRLYCHPSRRGRTQAINTIFQEMRGEFLVVVAADTLLCGGGVAHIVEKLSEPTVGMCWSRLVPIDDRLNLATMLGHLFFSCTTG